MPSYKKSFITKEMALQKLQRYCAYQERCHKEVRGKLLELGIYGQDLEEVITDLIRDDFLNEERFARVFARGKFRVKKWGRNKVIQKLKGKNVSEYCIKKGLSEIYEQEYRATLQELFEKKQLLLKEKNPYIRRKKLADYLIRKGYEHEMVWEIVQ